MTQPDPAKLLASASAERRGALTLITDPNCDPHTAHELLLRAWQSTAWLSRGEVPEAGGADLSSWLAPAHLELVPARRRAAIHETLVALIAAADRPAPWRADPGEPPSPTEPPSPAKLRTSARALSKIHEAMSLAQAGRSLRAKRALLWVARVAVVASFATALALAVVRPWQDEDTGPWRVAYYPSTKLKGDPELGRVRDIDFDWERDPPRDTVPADSFSARFDTCLTLEEDTEVAFMLVSDDGSRLLVDGERVVDNWSRPKGRPKRSKVKGERTQLEAGVHHLRVEYYEQSRNAELSLLASFAGELPASIPADMLTYPGDEPDEDDPCGSI